MTADIGPGDMVECVEGGDPFQTGAIYHVRAVVPPSHCVCINIGRRPWAFPHVGLLFCDAPDPRGPGWCVYSFKPISRRADFAEFLAAVGKPLDTPSPAKTPEIA